MATVVDPAPCHPYMGAGNGPQKLGIKHRAIGPAKRARIPFAFHGAFGRYQLLTWSQHGSALPGCRKIRKGFVIAETAHIIEPQAWLDVKIPVVPEVVGQEGNVGPGLETAFELALELVQLVAQSAFDRNPSGDRPHQFSG